MVEVVINQNDGLIQQTAAGGETTIDFDFPIYEKTHIKIIRTRAGVDLDMVLNTDYTIATNQLELTAGGAAALIGTFTPATAGDIFTMLLNVPEARTTDFNEAGDFKDATVNRELDLSAQQIQQIRRDITKAISFSETSGITAGTMPDPINNATILFDGTAGAMKIGPTSTAIAGAEASAAGAGASATTATTKAAEAAASAASIGGFDLSGATASNDFILYDSGDARFERRTVAQAVSVMPAFTGDSGAGGLKGLVAAPAAGDAAANKFLHADGTWSAVSVTDKFSTINIQTFTSSGTYTPTANMRYALIECVGGGGGGGGGNTVGVGGSGGAGGYSRIERSAATIGASQVVTIGAAGAGTTGAGGAGGNTVFGATILTCNGGLGGAVGVNGDAVDGGAGGTATGGDLNIAGGGGGGGFEYPGGGEGLSGSGGSSYFGGGGHGRGGLFSLVGINGVAYGSGGSGGLGTGTGGAGAAGLIIVTEYIGG